MFCFEMGSPVSEASSSQQVNVAEDSLGLVLLPCLLSRAGCATMLSLQPLRGLGLLAALQPTPGVSIQHPQAAHSASPVTEGLCTNPVPEGVCLRAVRSLTVAGSRFSDLLS